METRPVEKYVKIEGATNRQLSVTVDNNYADHPLVAGARYHPNDIRCTWSIYHGKNTSGVAGKYFNVNRYRYCENFF